MSSSSLTSDTDDRSEASDTEEPEDAQLAREIIALCLRGNRLGCARYRPRYFRVEVFEVPVFLGVELVTSVNVRGRPSGVPGGGAGGLKRKRADAVAQTRLLHRDDVPPSLLWLCQYVELHAPIALLPDSGADLLADVLDLSDGCTVLRLSATTGFNETRALPQLCAMYPQFSAMEIKSRFNTLHTSMLAAMAALLQYASTLRLNVADVVERGPVSTMYMNSEALTALQVTRQDAHPCSAQGVSQSKEGLSLLSVLDHTTCSMGRALLRQWLRLPSCDVEAIRRRQEVIALFLLPQYHELLVATRRALGGVHNTNHLFTLIRRGRARRRHYQTLHRTLQAVLTVHALVTPVAHTCPLLFDIVANHCRLDVLQHMAERLQRTVHGIRGPTGPHASCAQPVLPEVALARAEPPGDEHLSIHSEADATGLLGELRLHLHALGSVLDRYAHDAFNALDVSMRSTMSVRCVYISPYGYLICASRAALCHALESAMVPFSASDAAVRSARGPAPAEQSSGASDAWAQTVGYMQHRYGWGLHHEDDGTDLCYFKTAVMSDLDAKVGDLQRRIVERESELRRGMDESLLYLSLHLLAPSRALATLDCLLALSHVALQYQWCRPRLLEDRAGAIAIDGGWHPVLSRAIGASAIQPFSFRLGLDGSGERVCVLTGQNGSGKSVLLSAVALIALLTQIGSFVPASAASLSIFSSIWTSSACQDGRLSGSTFGTSSFAAECVAVNRLLRYCDGAQAAACATYADTHDADAAKSGGANRTVTPMIPVPLILLDEFGKGTATDDGRALLGAVVRYFSTPDATQAAAVLPDTCLRAATTATVLCTTHYLDVLWDGVRQARFPALAFPYEHVVLVDMRGEPVYDDSAPVTGGRRVAVDMVPTFQPHVVTARAQCHEADFLAYQSRLCLDAAVGGRLAGLPDELLHGWQNALSVLADPA